MANVDWSAVCDMAYFDGTGRLCLFGVEPGGIRTMPLGFQHLALVVRLTDRDPHDDLRPALFVTVPTGECRVADDVLDFSVESRGDYVIVHVPSLQIDQEGTYGFQLALGTCAPVMVELGIRAAAGRPVRTHLHGAR